MKTLIKRKLVCIWQYRKVWVSKQKLLPEQRKAIPVFKEPIRLKETASRHKCIHT